MPGYDGAEGLAVVREGAVLRLQLDRPQVRNAMTDPMMTAMVDALRAAEQDESVRVVVIESTGEHFCGGADIVARNTPTGERPRAGSIQRRVPHTAHQLIPLVCTVQVPVVCVVRGWAAGIGMQLALAADFTVADEGSRFWEPFTERGFTPDSGATWLLARKAGAVRARELLILGTVLDGRTAADWGLIHGAVPAGDVAVTAAELVATLAEAPTVAVGFTKWLLHEAEAGLLDDQLRREAFALELSSRSEDFREGLAAFKEKRAPKFSGR